MADVVGVHGTAQEQSGRHVLLHAWEPALQDGLVAAVQLDRVRFLLRAELGLLAAEPALAARGAMPSRVRASSN